MREHLLQRIPTSGWPWRVASVASIGLCISLWIGAKTVPDDERGNAERRALCIGHWAPMLWLIGETVERRRSASRAAGWTARLRR